MSTLIFRNIPALSGQVIARPLGLRGIAWPAVTLFLAGTVDAFGRKVPLQPDMTVTADIVLEERSLLDWLLEPLMSARGRM